MLFFYLRFLHGSSQLGMENTQAKVINPPVSLLGKIMGSVSLQWTVWAACCRWAHNVWEITV